MSGRTCSIGWLAHTDPRLTHRDSYTKQLKTRLENNIDFQLIPRTVKAGEYKSKALTIECSTHDAKQLSRDFMQKLNEKK